MDEYMTTADLAALLRTSPETVRYWRHVGRGPASFRAGRRVLYARTAVSDWIAAQQQRTGSGRAIA